MSLAAEDARPLSLSLSYLPPNAEMNGWHGKEWADSMLRCGLRLDYSWEEPRALQVARVYSRLPFHLRRSRSRAAKSAIDGYC